MKDLKDLVQSSRLDDPATESAPPQARHAPGELPDSVMSKQLAKLRALAESDREIISTLQVACRRIAAARTGGGRADSCRCAGAAATAAGRL